jgi:hypothetical protein
MSDKAFDLKIVEAKGGFFDRDAVIKELDPITRKVLNRFGAYVRITSRGYIKKARRMTQRDLDPEARKKYRRACAIALYYGRAKPLLPYKASEPGKPPKSITGLLKKFIFYSYDRATHSAVIGPALLNSPTGAPATLEFGGTAELTGGPDRGQTIDVKPRPYMKPAFELGLKQLDRFWTEAARR